jgi:hypothetical protein
MQPLFAASLLSDWCTLGMGVNLWGESPLYENLKVFIVIMLTKVRAEGKGGRANNRLKEAGVQTCETTDRNRIEGSVAGRASHTWQSP